MPRPDIDRFKQFYRVADKLVRDVTKEEVAEAARILALNLTQYQARYCELSAQEYLSLGTVDSLTPELTKSLADGTKVTVGVLGTLA